MTTSRRGFLRSLSGSAAAGLAMPWAVPALSKGWAFDPYHGEQDGRMILLNSNENAYGPSPKTIEAIKDSIANANRYPRLESGSLTEQIAHLHKVTPEQVLLGCGSTEVLRMAACAFAGSGKQLIQAAPTFGAIEHYARAVGSEVISVRLAPDFSHDLDGMLARMTGSTTLVYICNPNNPTASLTARKDLESFIGKLPATSFVVIDEAYHHYAASGRYASFLDHPVHDDRVIVVRTFSKVYGLAGLRLGYGVAAPAAAQQMRKFATETNINTIVTQAAAAALNDTAAVDAAVARNLDDQQEFFNQALGRTLKPIDSHANFVMVNTFHPVDEIIEYFHKNNILIGRHFPPMDTHIRVSFGRPEEMLAFWRAWDMLPFAKEMTMPH